MKDLASHGHIAFALNHADGTCMYTEDSQGVEVTHGEWDTNLKDYRRDQVNKRVEELLSAIGDLSNMD